jgi:exonuclease VII large subunit
MIDHLNFNNHYEDLLKQLPPSVKKDVWLRLTTRKNNPLSEEQIRGIHSDIEELLTREINRYYRKRDRQKIKIEANTASDGSSTLSKLDGFEKQLEEREALLKQKENNIKKTIEDRIAEEHKRLKDEYDALKSRLENEYNNCMVDMKQKTYLFKHQLEDQQKSSSDNLEKQYKSRISTLEKSIVVKDKEIGKLSASIPQLKNDKNALKKDFASAKKTIKVLDGIIYSKDKTIIAYNEGVQKINPGCIDDTIELTSFYEKNAKVLWTR